MCVCPDTEFSNRVFRIFTLDNGHLVETISTKLVVHNQSCRIWNDTNPHEIHENASRNSYCLLWILGWQCFFEDDVGRTITIMNYSSTVMYFLNELNTTGFTSGFV